MAVALALASLAPLAGCNAAPADDDARQETQGIDAVSDKEKEGAEKAAADDTPSFDLATFANPFIGTWESDIPSANTKLTFVYRVDGIFDYEMEGVPAAEGGKGTGAYLINGDVQVSYLDYEGAAAYVFEVVDNNTIDVTEVEEVTEAGEFVLGETAPFKRVVGSKAVETDQPFELDNPFIGTWNAQIPNDEDPTMVFDVTMEFADDGLSTFTLASDPTGFKGSYAVYGDVLVTYDPSAKAIETFAFERVDDDTVSVTELLSVNPDGTRSLGATVPFKRVA
jgi:hypothetical protein